MRHLAFAHLPHRLVIGAALTATAAVLALTPTFDVAAAADKGSSESSQSAPILDGGAARTVPDSYLVVLKDTAPAHQVTSLPASLGVRPSHTYTSALHGFAAELSSAELASVRASSDVAFVEVDHRISLPRSERRAGLSTNIVQQGATWGLDRIDQRSGLNNHYRYTRTGAGVTVFMLDTGIRATHTEFGGRVKAGFTAIADGNGTNDCQGHGTHTAGTVGGKRYGVAKAVTLVPVRVLDCNGEGTVSTVIAGIDWASAQAVRPAVANMSLGGDVSTALDTAVSNSIRKGIQYSIAAGNASSDACEQSPARVPAAVTVGATSGDDFVAPYSNWGDCLDIWAPGDYITSAYNTSNTAAAVLDGTSMAAPHVAGVMAQYLQADPTATPKRLRDHLVADSTKNALYGAFGPNRLLYMGPTG